MAGPGACEAADVDWLKKSPPLCLCRLVGTVATPDGAVIESCTIITTTTNDLMAPIHNRMPVILAPPSYDQWLDPAFQRIEPLNALLRPYPCEELTVCPVSTFVNNPRHDVPECLEPLPV